LIALGVGCDQPTATNPTNTTNPPAVKPDNTGVNVRDRDAQVKTPIDQNENQADIDVTAKIRKQVVDTKMSINAQNGQVTLRGPVKSEEEKKRVEEIAHSVAGADKVVSQLEVEP